LVDIQTLEHRDLPAETANVRPRGAAAALLGVFVLMVPVVAASSYSERSVGTPEQIAWVRHAAHRFVAAELAADGAEACAVLNAPLRATTGGRTCAQRWDTRLVRTTKKHGMRSRLRAQLRAIASARIVVRGDVASIELPMALLHGSSRFLWTENCWMLED
jgi:hypothetical protein